MPRTATRVLTASAAAFAILAGSPTAHAAVLHVTAGADLRKALDQLRRLPVRSKSEPVVLELGAGDYFLPHGLTITAEDSGTKDHPVEIRASKGAHVVLRGARRLTGLRWTVWRGRIWRAKVAGPSFDQLWRGDRPLVRARYPNFDPGKSPFGGVAADATSPERVKRWSNPAGGVVHGIDANRWGSLHFRILGKGPDGKLRLAPPTGINRDVALGGEQVVENIFEELDAPGEWYYDQRSGWLYLIPASGGTPPDALIASATKTILTVRGTSARPVHDVSIVGLEFRDTAQSILDATEPLLRSDWKFDRSGAVLLEGVERVAVRGSDFEQLGGNAVVVSGFARGVDIADNIISHIGGDGIAFVGRPDAVRSPLFEYRQSQPLASIDRTPGPKSPNYPSDSIAQDNLIHDVGEIDKEAAGVEISMSARITIDHNSIYRVPRAGINVGDGTWGGHLIENNDVFETVLETGDNGAFNSWGRDRYWDPDRDEMNRRVAAEPSLVFLDVVEPIVLRHNRFRCDHGWDIDLDDGSSNYIIEDNVLLSGGLKFREGFTRHATNNVIYNNSFHPHVWFANSGDTFEHNIVMAGYQPILMSHWGKRVDDNLFPTDTALARARANGTDAHSIVGLPQFKNPARGDLSVRPGSPAFEIGFRNFPMSGFGVTSPRLRKLAQTPTIPPPLYGEGAAAAAPREAFGMSFKSVQTLGEQSAAGLPTKAGVLVLSVSPTGPAAAAHLRAGDVILRVLEDESSQPDPTNTAEEFIAAVKARLWRGAVKLEVFRNQQRITVDMPTR